MGPSRTLIQTTLFALLTLSTAGRSAELAYEDYTVRRGQTTSYIAILKYGSWNDSVAAVLQADNPQLKNLQMISAGSVLKFRKPAELSKESLDPKRKVELASRKGVVTAAQGEGSIRRAKGTVEKLVANVFVATGDVISTGPGAFAEIIIDNQSVLRLAQNTEVKLTAIQEPRAATASDLRTLVTRISLTRGRTWSKVQKWAGSIVSYQIQLPTAIAGVHGTVFESEVTADSSGLVAVHQGEVGVQGGSAPEAPKKSLAPKPVNGPKEVSMGEWIRILKDGQRISISKNGEPGQPETFEVDAADPWTQINRDRDCLCD